MPSIIEFNNCLNQFYWITGNVIKGLSRKNLIYANEQNNQYMRPELLQLLQWLCGLRKNWQFDAGVSSKNIHSVLTAEEARQLKQSYTQDSIKNAVKEITCQIALMRSASREVAKRLAWSLPPFIDGAEKQLSNWLVELNRD